MVLARFGLIPGGGFGTTDPEREFRGRLPVGGPMSGRVSLIDISHSSSACPNLERDRLWLSVVIRFLFCTATESGY